MKVKGIKVEYYMKNEAVLVDDLLQFVSPIEDTNSDYIKFYESARDLAKVALKAETGGHVVFGTLYVRASEIQAIRLLPIEGE